MRRNGLITGRAEQFEEIADRVEGEEYFYTMRFHAPCGSFPRSLRQILGMAPAVG